MKLLWKYYENSIKIILFKFILVGFKQNLGRGYSNIYFKRVKTIYIFIIYIKKKNSSWSGGSFEPLAST